MRRLVIPIALIAASLLPALHAHEVPSDVTVRMLVRPEGDRIRLLVDRAGDARIEVLDADGRVVFSAPEAAARTP